MKRSFFTSILLGFTFAFVLWQGEFNWIMWGSLMFGGTIAYLGINYLKRRRGT
jgi:hypothetical protein